MTGPEQCIEMAESVISDKKGDAARTWLIHVAAGNIPEIPREGMSGRLAAFIGDYAMAKRTGGTRDDHAKAGKRGASYEETPNVPRRQVYIKRFQIQLRDAKPDTGNGLINALNDDNTKTKTLTFKPFNWRAGDDVILDVQDAVLPSARYISQLSKAPFAQYIKNVTHSVQQ